MSRRQFEVLWSEIAIRDLERIVDFLEGEAQMAAQRLFDQIAERPDSGEPASERKNCPRARPLRDYDPPRVVDYPYRLIYRIDSNRVLVVALFDGRRNLEDVLLSRVSSGR